MPDAFGACSESDDKRKRCIFCDLVLLMFVDHKAKMDEMWRWNEHTIKTRTNKWAITSTAAICRQQHRGSICSFKNKNKRGVNWPEQHQRQDVTLWKNQRIWAVLCHGLRSHYSTDSRDKGTNFIEVLIVFVRPFRSLIENCNLYINSQKLICWWLHG